MERYITRTVKSTEIEFIITVGTWNDALQAYEAGTLQNEFSTIDTFGELKSLDEAVKVLAACFPKGAKIDEKEVIAVTPVKINVVAEKYRMLEKDFIRWGEKIV